MLCCLSRLAILTKQFQSMKCNLQGEREMFSSRLTSARMFQIWHPLNQSSTEGLHTALCGNTCSRQRVCRNPFSLSFSRVFLFSYS